MFLPHPRVKVSIVGSLRDREVACSASDRQGSNFESCVWRTVSSQSSYHPQEVLLAQFILYVHKGDLKLDSFHFTNLLCPKTYVINNSNNFCTFLIFSFPTELTNILLLMTWQHDKLVKLRDLLQGLLRDKVLQRKIVDKCIKFNLLRYDNSH